MSTREAIALAEDYDRISRQLEDDAIARLNAALDGAYKQSEAELRRIYPNLPTGLASSQRRVAIAEQLNSVLQVIKPDQQTVYEELFGGLLRTANESGDTLAGELIRAIAPDSFVSAFTAVNLEAAAFQARDGVRRLAGHEEKFRNNATRIVAEGLLQGWGTRRVEQQLRGQLGTLKYRAEAIARTEYNGALNDSAQSRYERNGVEGVQLIPVGDDRVCPYCAARAGNVYAVGKIRLPLHVLDRCVLLPWKQSWQAEGITDDEFVADFRDKSLRAIAGSPNFGVAPFERSNGLIEPPTPIWQPAARRRSVIGGLSNATPDSNDEVPTVARNFRVLSSQSQGVRSPEELEQIMARLQELKSQGARIQGDSERDQEYRSLRMRKLKLEADAYFNQAAAQAEPILRLQRPQVETAFSKAPVAFQRVVQRFGHPSLELPTPDSANYNSQTGKIHMDNIELGFAEVYRHEWGHYLDNQLAKGSGSRFWSSSQRFREAIAQDAERIMQDRQSYSAQIFDFEFSGSRTGMAPVGADLAGAITLNQVGYGHSDEYYQQSEGNRYTEAFANIIALLGSGNSADKRFAEAIAPNTAKLVQSELTSSPA